MAQALVAGQILRATVWCNQVGQAAANTWYYRVVGVGAPAATDLDFATNIDALTSAPYKARLNNNATYQGVQGQIVKPTILVSQPYIASAGAGTAGATGLPKQSAGITSWYTVKAGRAFRGRTYWPFPASADDTGGGAPTAGYVAGFEALAVALQGFTAVSNGGRTATVAMVIFHRRLGNTDDIVNHVTHIAWATQRRRGTYGHPNSSPI